MSSFRMTVMQRSRRSWTSWSLRRTARRQQRATARLTLLQLELQAQHLLIKELAQQEQTLLHRQRELQEAQAFLTQPPPQPPQDLRELLGLPKA